MENRKKSDCSIGIVHAEKNAVWRCCAGWRNPRSTSSTPVVAPTRTPSQTAFFYLWVGTGAMLGDYSLGVRWPSATIRPGDE